MKRPRISGLRIGIIFVLVALGWIAVLGRFAQIQVVQGARFEELVLRQCWGKFKLNAKRGNITDCRGNILAFDVPSESFFTYVKDKKYLRKLGRSYGSLTGNGSLTDRLLKRPGEFNWLVRRADPELASRLKALGFDSVQVQQEFSRVHPYGNLGMDILGQVDIDNVGTSGLESTFDQHLKPDPGLVTFQRDGRGKVYRVSEVPAVRPRAGCDLMLTIDAEYQQIVEEELRIAVGKWDALSGIAVFIEARSGRILAADYYSPDNEVCGESPVFKSRIVTDLFEPGSTFKIVAFAGMIETEAYELTDSIWAGMGEFKFNGRTLHDDKELDTISFRRAFELSSNIATARFSQKLGGKALFKFARDFGFGQPTGVDIQGEQRGMLGKPRNWSEFWIAQTSIGHGMSVNALQLANAFAAIANGGKLMRPFVVEEIRSESGRLKQRFSPHQIRQVVSERTAGILQDLMGGVVDSGTAKVARIDEVLFSGKTGTAQKPDLENGGYFQNKYMASFAGFFPRNNPRIAGVVIIDEPKRINYGGYTSGPAFAEIARRITLLEKTRRDWIVAESESDTSGNSSGSKPQNGSYDSRRSAWAPESESEPKLLSSWVTPHAPENNTCSGDRIEKVTGRIVSGILPDTRGLAMRDAVALLSKAGCDVKAVGKGFVSSQVPKAGCPLEDAGPVVIKCDQLSGGSD